MTDVFAVWLICLQTLTGSAPMANERMVTGMDEWASMEILDTSFITHRTPNGYEIHFSTPDREKYLAVQEECRRQVDHAKTTNADRIRSMSDEELAKFIERSDCPPYDGTCDKDNITCSKCWLDWLQSPTDGGDHNAAD